jgi:prevent-host-death family protein
MVKHVSVQTVRPNLSALLREVAGQNEHVIIARYGRPIGALVSMKDLKRIWDDEEDEKYGPRNPQHRNSRPGGYPYLRPDWGHLWCPQEGWAPHYRKRKAAEKEARREARSEARAKEHIERQDAEKAGRKWWWFGR